MILEATIAEGVDCVESGDGGVGGMDIPEGVSFGRGEDLGHRVLILGVEGFEEECEEECEEEELRFHGGLGF